jgi:electron transfer flavoprotein alpha subunit
MPESNRSNPPVATIPVITVLSETRWGRVERLTYELLSDARKLAASLRGRVEVILLGSEGTVSSLLHELTANLSETIHLVEDDALQEFSTEAYVSALCGVLNSINPAILFLGATANGRDFAPRLAARMRYAYFPHCLSVKALAGKLLEITRVTHGGRAHVVATRPLDEPVILTMKSGVADIIASPKKASPEPAIRKHSVKVSMPTTRVKARIPADPATQDIRDAERLISGGRGLGSKEGFAVIWDLADALGAAVAASRAAVDLGWIEYARQVGQTGKSVAPRLYLAAGISGASHHLMGMRDSQKIVALNIDRQAPIFSVAHLGVVGDLHQILPRLTQKVKDFKQPDCEKTAADLNAKV